MQNSITQKRSIVELSFIRSFNLKAAKWAEQ